MAAGDGRFPVDDCFGQGTGRGPLDSLAHDTPEGAAEMVTFEEFIRGVPKKKWPSAASGGAGGIAELDLRPIDEDDDDDGTDVADGFFDIALDTCRVPDDPPTSGARAKGGGGSGAKMGGRGKLYTVQQQQEGGGDSAPPNYGHHHGSLSLSAASFRQSFCPTVGEGARWLGVGGPRRDSQDSAAYGYDAPPEEPKPAGAIAKMPRIGQFGAPPPPPRTSAGLDSFRGAAPQAGGEEEAGQLVIVPPPPTTQSSHNLLLSKFFCCFRAVDPNGAAERRHCGGVDKMGGAEDDYGMMEGAGRKGGGGERPTPTEQQPKLYSWDLRPGLSDAKEELLWQGLVGETRVKEPGQLAGNAFQIEACSNSILVLMDQSASVTIDDCRDCVILCGPCRGSIFLRDCTNLLILAVCQQFRTRDCRQLTAHLFCSTCPTIEETDMRVGPLLLNYAGLQTQMFASDLSPFVNKWAQVHNFTPDTGKCQVRHGADPTMAGGELAQKLGHFLATSEWASRWQLGVGSPLETRLFFEMGGKKGADGQQHRALVLIQPLDGAEPGQRFYSEAVDMTRELLSATPGINLVAMHDIDLRPGEWDTIMGRGGGGRKGGGGRGRKEAAAQQKQTRKIVAIEVSCPPEARSAVESICGRREGMKATTAQLVDSEQMELYRTQLYRLCEIRQSI